MPQLACVWHEERFYTAGPVLRNGTGDVADGKPWISHAVQWIYHSDLHNNPCVQTLYKRIPLTLLTSWLLALYAQSAP